MPLNCEILGVKGTNSPITPNIFFIFKIVAYSISSIAATHFCLQATELGLETCIIGWFDEKKVRKLLQIPNKKRIPLLLTVGYSTDELRKKQRKELKAMYSSNKY